MDTGVPIGETTGLGTHKTIKFVNHYPIPYYNDTYTAHTAAPLISRLKIYRRKIEHTFLLTTLKPTLTT